jgi:hypothetical protein
MWTTHFAEPAVHPIKRNGSPDVPAGTSRRVQRRTVILQASGCRDNAGGSVKQLAGLAHGMHHHRQLARHGDGRSLEAHSSRSLTPQARSVLSAELRVKMTVAAS